MAAVQDIVDALEAASAEVDWLQVHSAGCTCDDTELPHHVTDLAQVEEMCARMFNLLTSIGDR